MILNRASQQTSFQTHSAEMKDGTPSNHKLPFDGNAENMWKQRM
jgi:hypothetical protein